MKLKAKFEDEDIKLGEVVDAVFVENERIQIKIVDKAVDCFYDSIDEFRDEWEDYEEPKSGIRDVWFPNVIAGRNNVVIGFVTKEEAEEAVEKLKAWKRLRDKGFRFNGLCESVYELPAIEYDLDVDVVSRDSQEHEDLDLLFGGKE